MTLAEFKAWMSGFSASFKDGVPDEEQWKLIGQKLAGVRESLPPPTFPVYPQPYDWPKWPAPSSPTYPLYPIITC